MAWALFGLKAAWKGCPSRRQLKLCCRMRSCCCFSMMLLSTQSRYAWCIFTLWQCVFMSFRAHPVWVRSDTAANTVTERSPCRRLFVKLRQATFNIATFAEPSYCSARCLELCKIPDEKKHLCKCVLPAKPCCCFCRNRLCTCVIHVSLQ